MHAVIAAIDYYLPTGTLTNADLAREFPEWTVDRIEAKTGIQVRHIAAEDECASDLAVHASRKLFAACATGPADIDFILLCTQSPDYYLPTTACLLQDALGVPVTAGALDVNLGCSGFVYGLGLAKGLIETDQAHNVLLLTAETYSKHLHPADKSVRTIFGDGAAATLVSAANGCDGSIGPFVYGTDGSGAENLIVPIGGFRNRYSDSPIKEYRDPDGNVRTAAHLKMDGPEIFAFTLRAVPGLVESLLSKAKLAKEDVALYVFHQANRHMLQHLRKKIGIPEERFVIALEDSGNTVSATIPTALCRAHQAGRLHTGDRVMLVGYGVGYSWAGAIVEWSTEFVGAPAGM